MKEHHSGGKGGVTYEGATIRAARAHISLLEPTLPTLRIPTAAPHCSPTPNPTLPPHTHCPHRHPSLFPHASFLTL